MSDRNLRTVGISKKVFFIVISIEVPISSITVFERLGVIELL